MLRHGTRGAKGRDTIVLRFRLHESGVGALRIGLRRSDTGLRALQVGRGLLQRSLEQGGVDQRDDIALTHPGIEVRVELGNPAGHLRPDLDGGDRIDGPRRIDRIPDFTALHGSGEV